MSGPRTSEPGALGQGEDLVDDLLDRLALDLVAVRAVRVADAGEEQSQVVVDLGHRADRRPRVAEAPFWSIEMAGERPSICVDVGLLHLAEELPGVGAQALDVAALALGVDGVEGEARLAAPGQPGDDDEPVAREGDRDVLEVVFAGTANEDPDPAASSFSLTESMEWNMRSVVAGDGRVRGLPRVLLAASTGGARRSSLGRAAVGQLGAEAPRRRPTAAADAVEAEQGRPDDRRPVEDDDPGPRGDGPDAGLDAGEEARVARPDETAGEDDLDVAAGPSPSGGSPRVANAAISSPRCVDELERDGVPVGRPRRRRPAASSRRRSSRTAAA